MAKCDGLSDDLRRARPVATPLLSLHNLVCHLAETERNWFSRILEAKLDLGRIWYDPAVEGSLLVPLEHTSWEEDLAAYRKQCEHSRRVAAARSFDDCGVWRGKQVSTRSTYLT